MNTRKTYKRSKDLMEEKLGDKKLTEAFRKSKHSREQRKISNSRRARISKITPNKLRAKSYV